MISCHASPVALLKRTQVTVKVHTHVHKVNANTAQQWQEQDLVLSVGIGLFVEAEFLEYGSRITWREGSRPGKRSGSCCGDLLRSPQSARCFQTPEAAGEQGVFIECKPHNLKPYFTVIMNYRDHGRVFPSNWHPNTAHTHVFKGLLNTLLTLSNRVLREHIFLRDWEITVFFSDLKWAGKTRCQVLQCLNQDLATF